MADLAYNVGFNKEFILVKWREIIGKVMWEIDAGKTGKIQAKSMVYHIDELVFTFNYV